MTHAAEPSYEQRILNDIFLLFFAASFSFLKDSRIWNATSKGFVRIHGPKSTTEREALLRLSSIWLHLLSKNVLFRLC